MAEAIATGAAANVLSTLFVPVIQQIDDLIHFAGNIASMKSELDRVRNIVTDIREDLQSEHRIVRRSVEDWLERVQNALQTAKQILDAYQNSPLHHQRCFTCFFHPGLGRKIRRWQTEVDLIFQQGNSGFSIMDNIRQVSSAPHDEAEELFQPVPETGFVGSQIQSAQKELQSWLMEDVNASVIGVYGMGGIGKTSLLKNIYNNQEVRKFFDVVIWATVSQNVNAFELQDCIAHTIHLDLMRVFNIDLRKMKLCKRLKEMKFLLVLDDLWKQLILEELGVESVKARGSKVVITTRDEEVCRTMKADKWWKMEPLSDTEGWELFRKGAIVEAEVEDIAKEIALECKGLPLAINVVSTAMRGLRDRNEWELALNQMKRVDPAFSTTHSGIERNLYQPLRWSYDSLPDSNLRNCFLCCAMFPEDADIDAEELIEMWIAEGLIKSREQGYLFDTGRRYLQLLIDRCLLESTSRDDFRRGFVPCIKMHDVLRDLAIYIGEKEENCLFRAGQKLKKFPSEEEETRACKRISLLCNDIESLPQSFTCPGLVSLVIAENSYLREILDSFLLNLTSLKALDLSKTNIQSLPTSWGQLQQLKLLRLKNTLIKELPESVCYLNRLEFLDLSFCHSLTSLPSRIGNLQCLKRLKLEGCSSLAVIPREISQLTSLESLPIRVGTMNNWMEMRTMYLRWATDGQEDLPEDGQRMDKLQYLALQNYSGRRLPNWICEFQKLRYLLLFNCRQLGELPALEMLPNLKRLEIRGCRQLKMLGEGFGREGAFPMLEVLNLHNLPKLESLVGSTSNTGVIEERAMARLENLSISACERLSLPFGMMNLKGLKRLFVDKEEWRERMRYHLSQQVEIDFK
eukprot:Gb_18201 [translate_table: standard]